MSAFSGAVLAGGASTRMGRDKALVEVDGRPLVLVAADALRGAGGRDVVAIGGGPAVERLGLPVVPDRWPGEGPLGAIVTALASASAEVVVVLSCDLPFVTSETVRDVVDAIGTADAAVPEVDGRRQVLLAAYRRRTCLDAFERAFAAGERAPRHALDGLDVVPVALRDPRTARNANRPEDLP